LEVREILLVLFMLMLAYQLL